MDLVTHINNSPVEGLIHREIVELIMGSDKQVVIHALPMDKTTIQTCGRRRNPSSSKMARRKKQKRKRDSVERRRRSGAVFRRSSLKRASTDGSRASLAALGRQGGSETSPRSPTSRSPRSPPMFHVPAEHASSTPLTSSPNSSPSSSCPNSPAGHFTSSRPSTLQGLHKLPFAFRPGGNRRKSVGHIPLSPLARTPNQSPAPKSPVRSPSPLAVVTSLGHSPGSSNTTQSYPAQKLSSPTLSAPMKVKTKKYGMRARNLETPPSPLLRRALSPDHEKMPLDMFEVQLRPRADSACDSLSKEERSMKRLGMVSKEKVAERKSTGST